MSIVSTNYNLNSLGSEEGVDYSENENLYPNRFSETKNVSQKLLNYFKNMNPFYALFNCPVTTYKTAYMLEHGYNPDLKLSMPCRPRPMDIDKMVAKWPKLLTRMDSNNRSTLYMSSCTESMIQHLMTQFGPGTHAIIGGRWKNSKFGHLWNCIVDHNHNLIIIDSYSKAHHETGLKNPTKFMSNYNTDNLTTLIFFNTTSENQQLAAKFSDI